MPAPNSGKSVGSSLKAVLKAGEGAINSARALTENYVQIGKHVEKIAEVSGKNPPQNSDRALDAIIEHLQKVGESVFGDPPQAMTPQQISEHHRHLNAILPLLKANAGMAASLARHIEQMRKHLASVANLYKSQGK